MSVSHSRAILNEVLKLDLYSFVERSFHTLCPGQAFLPNWHVEAYVHYLMECYLGRSARLIVNVPPRHLKSNAISVAYVAWLLGKDPMARIICVSYSSDLAARHSRDCRRLLESDWYKQVFPKTRINPRKNTETEFETTLGGGRFATSVGGTLTGRGGNWVIIDDPMKAEDAASASARKTLIEWYSHTLFSRLDDKQTGVIILVTQRLHQDDLTAHLLDTGPWNQLLLPAIAAVPQDIPVGGGKIHHRSVGDVLHPAREPRESLVDIRSQLGESAFAAQYQQTPVPPGGAMIKWEWFRFYVELPHNYDSHIVQSWDTANTANERSDYSVCTTWALVDDRYYLLDVFRKRMDFPTLVNAVRLQSQQWKAHTVVVEDIGAGTSLLQEFDHYPLVKVQSLEPFKPEGDKILRMDAHTAKLEAGRVYLPKEAAWLTLFRDEVLAFPEGRHDDQVDSMSQILGWCDWRERNTMSVVPLRRVF